MPPHWLESRHTEKGTSDPLRSASLKAQQQLFSEKSIRPNMLLHDLVPSAYVKGESSVLGSFYYIFFNC